MPTMTFLIGLPGTGKSTFRALLEAADPNIVVISTDDMIEDYAADRGMTYTEAYRGVSLDDLEAIALRLNDRAARLNMSVIIDRTNLRFKTREKFRNAFYHYLVPDLKTVAVVFACPEEEHIRRLNNRPGKEIPWAVIETMKASYEPPQHGEFDEVWVVDHKTGDASLMENYL